MYPTKKEEVARDNRGLYGYVHYEGPLVEAVDIARHYGFNLIEPITFSRRLPNTLTENQKERVRKKDLSGFPPGKMAVLKKYIEEKMEQWPQPVMLTHISEGEEEGSQEFRLDILGTKKSIAEALVLRVGTAILDSWGYKNLVIHLNGFGDADSYGAFERELHNHYKKNFNNLSSCCRQQMKKALLGVLDCKREKCALVKEAAPKSINFLGEQSRRHLSEIVEFIEHLNVPFRINDSLVGNHYCYPKTVFHIREELDSGEDIYLARGERHDHLSKEIGVMKKVPLVSLALSLKADQRKKDRYRAGEENTKHPKIYFAHIGYDARLRSLRIMEILRRCGVPIKYMVGIDSISRQIRQAEVEKARFVIILGQKEVLEDTVMCRDMETRYQESIPSERLPEYIKALRKEKLI